VTKKRTALTAVLAVVGLALAVGVGLAANAVSDDSVGLSATPLRAGQGLAPPEAREGAEQRRGERRRAERARQHRAARRRQAKRAQVKAAQAVAPAPATPVQPPAQPATPAPPSKRGDDGAENRGRGSEPDADEESGDHDSDDDSSPPESDEDSGEHESDD
jgi:hypothetical protein